MSIIINTSPAARNEIAELSSVPNWLISHTNSAPAIGQVDDSILGMAELTKSRVKLNKYHAMLVFQDNTVLPDLSHIVANTDDTITGRDCISHILESTPINFTRNAEWYDTTLTPYIKYDPTETTVRIENGKVLSGIMDKKSIAKKSSGGVYHIIANEYGAEAALESMFNMQQTSIAYIMQFGHSMGVMDIRLSEQSKKEISDISSDIINKSKLITEKLNNGEIVPPIGKSIEEFYEELQINTLTSIDDFISPILSSIDPETNNLFRLIKYGSKGALHNMFNIVSSVGQKLINGERVAKKFGFSRTLAYFPRFDNSPESRGYITNSFLAGMNASEYIYNAMAARFDLITKALTTSVTGDLNRQSVKNLESVIINNYRASFKAKLLLQLAYGGDFIDPRRAETVKFTTVSMADKDFEALTHKDYKEFYNKMSEDRQTYRKIFLRVENSNIKELFSDDKQVPVNVGRIVNDLIVTHSEILKEPTANELKELVDIVNNLINNIPYVAINEIQERLQTPIPQYIDTSTWLLKMQIRTHLHPNQLLKLKMNKQILNIICDKIRLRYSQALVEPGTAVGVIAAQSFSEPLTQYMLDAHHRSATGGTSKSSMVNAKEILGAKEVDSLTAPSMFIQLLPEFAGNKAKISEIANNIETMTFGRFIVVWRIFYEKFAEPIHSKFIQDKQWINNFIKLNPLLTVPADLIRYCIRFTLNKTTLILKNMSVESIINRLREIYRKAFFVYTSENSEEIVIRVYMRNTMFKQTVELQLMEETVETMMNTIIRGVDRILNTKIMPLIRSKIDDNGKIAPLTDKFAIVTTGTNLPGVLANPFVDKLSVNTDAIQEIAKILGIEAARTKIIHNMRDIINVNARHYSVYADTMTSTGRVTSIQSGGMRSRDFSNVLLKVGYSSPLSALEEAAMHGLEDTISGLTSPLLVGTTPKLGSLYNNLYANSKFIKENIKNTDDYLDDLKN